MAITCRFRKNESNMFNYERRLGIMNIALLTAGGVGSRMHNDIPKQFLNIEDKPMIIYTMEKFQTHPSIDWILSLIHI